MFLFLNWYTDNVYDIHTLEHSIPQKRISSYKLGHLRAPGRTYNYLRHGYVAMLAWQAAAHACGSARCGVRGRDGAVTLRRECRTQKPSGRSSSHAAQGVSFRDRIETAMYCN